MSNVPTFESNEDDAQLQAERRGKSKLTAKKSIFASQQEAQASAQASFDSQVEEFQQQAEAKKNQATQLIQDYMEVFNDKTLTNNKGPKNKEQEKKLLSDLVTYCVQLNQDENEPEGVGSIAAISLILKTLVSQRDRLNQLEYELELAKAELTRYHSKK